MTPPLLIVNPACGARGRGARALSAVLAGVERTLGDVLIRYTARRGHARELAQAGTLDGHPLIVAVGGDGTFSEIANGVLTARAGEVGGMGDGAPLSPVPSLGGMPAPGLVPPPGGAAAAVSSPAVGLINVGTGGDFRRSLGIGPGFEHCLEALALGRERLVDVGRARFPGRNGEDVEQCTVEHLARLVAYVPQEHRPPFPYLVREVVLMGRTPHLGGFFGVKRRDKEIAMDALATLEIGDLADRPYNHLSGGQRQMVLMARAIAQDTPVLFLDEPTSALDFQNQMRIWQIMRDIAGEGKTILACSHDPNHVAWFCDRVVVVGSGSVVAEGRPEDVISEDVLAMIYQDACTVRMLDGVRMVMPRCVAERHEKQGSELPLRGRSFTGVFGEADAGT